MRKAELKLVVKDARSEAEIAGTQPQVRGGQGPLQAGRHKKQAHPWTKNETVSRRKKKLSIILILPASFRKFSASIEMQTFMLVIL